MTLPAAFDPFDPAFLDDPFPFYALGRRFAPVFFIPGAGVWSVFRYEDCVAILRDVATWSSAPPAAPDGVQVPEPPMLFSDPPRHTRLRTLVSSAFTPAMVQQLEPRIRALADRLLDDVAAAGRCDIVEALAYPLPVIVIAEILGIPAEDRAQFKAWSDDAVRMLGRGLNPQAGEYDVPGESFAAMREYLERMAAERRARPGPDLISRLVAAESDASKLSAAELIQMLILLLVAGNETTTNLIGNAILEFMAHPDQLELVRDSRAPLPGAVEEVLRYASPVQATARRARRDVELAGQMIHEGQQAVVWLASANRDPAVFALPDEFDAGRSPNRHIAFGLGPHFCLGAPLARLEARVALEVFLRRFRDFRREGDGPLPRVPTFIMRGVRELPIAFEPAS